jgi:hypothetical protein
VERLKQLAATWSASPEAATAAEALSKARTGGIAASSLQAMAPLPVQLEQLGKRAGHNAW